MLKQRQHNISSRLQKKQQQHKQHKHKSKLKQNKKPISNLWNGHIQQQYASKSTSSFNHKHNSQQSNSNAGALFLNNNNIMNNLAHLTLINTSSSSTPLHLQHTYHNKEYIQSVIQQQKRHMAWVFPNSRPRVTGKLKPLQDIDDELQSDNEQRNKQESSEEAHVRDEDIFNREEELEALMGSGTYWDALPDDQKQAILASRKARLLREQERIFKRDTESMRIWQMRNDAIDAKYKAIVEKQPKPLPTDNKYQRARKIRAVELVNSEWGKVSGQHHKVKPPPARPPGSYDTEIPDARTVAIGQIQQIPNPEHRKLLRHLLPNAFKPKTFEDRHINAEEFNKANFHKINEDMPKEMRDEIMMNWRDTVNNHFWPKKTVVEAEAGKDAPYHPIAVVRHYYKKWWNVWTESDWLNQFAYKFAPREHPDFPLLRGRGLPPLEKRYTGENRNRIGQVRQWLEQDARQEILSQRYVSQPIENPSRSFDDYYKAVPKKDDYNQFGEYDPDPFRVPGVRAPLHANSGSRDPR